MRWVSLLPAASAWFQALDRLSWLIGRSHIDETAPDVAKLPVCTRFHDEQSREPWEAFLSPLPIDVGALAALRPDGILTSFQLAIPDIEVSSAIAALQKNLGYAVQVLSLHAQDWEGYKAVANQVGQALKNPKTISKLMTQAEKRRTNLLAKSAQITHDISVLILTPEKSFAHIHAGWGAYFAPWVKLHMPPLQGPLMRWETIVELDPEVIIVTHPEETLTQAGQRLAKWSRQPMLQTLSAYRAKHIYAMDGQKSLFSTVPDLIATAEALYEILHTPTYRFNKHLGRLWAPLL